MAIPKLFLGTALIVCLLACSEGKPVCRVEPASVDFGVVTLAWQNTGRIHRRQSDPLHRVKNDYISRLSGGKPAACRMTPGAL
jgi:hypothetical protein